MPQALHTTIRACQPTDIPLLAPLERSAAAPFTAYPALASLALDSADPAHLHSLISAKNAWESGDAGTPWACVLVAEVEGEVVGFLSAKQVDASVHVEEVSVGEGWQGRGVGGALVREVLGMVVDGKGKGGLDGSCTLRTFREVPWNKPWYERFGFVEVEAEEMGTGHVEIARGDPLEREGFTRCIMVKR